MRLIVPVAVAAGLLSLLVVLTVEGLEDVVLAQSIIVIGASVLVMAVGVLWDRDGRLPWLCDPLLLSFLFLAQFYIIGPFAVRFVDVFQLPFAYKYSPDKQVVALLAFLTFVTGTVVGHKLRLGALLGAALPDFRGGGRRLPAAWIEFLLIGGGIAGIFGWLLFQGGLAARLSEGYGTGRGGGAMFRIAFVAVQSGTLLLAWRMFSKRATTTLGRAWFLGLLAFQVLAFGVLIGMRKYLLFLFFGTLTVWILRRGFASLPKAKIAALFFLLLVFFSFWGEIRNRPLGDLIEGSENPLYAETGPFYHGYLNAVGGPFEVACLVYELYPEQEKFRHGGTLLVTLLGFIPRAIWPEKPIGIGKEITQYIVGPFYEPTYGFSVTVTLPADLYINFGWLGLAFGGLLFGILCRTVGAYATHGMRDGVQTVAARAVLPAVFVMGLGEVRADMSMMLMAYALSFVPLLFAFAFFRIDIDPEEALEADVREVTPHTRVATGRA